MNPLKQERASTGVPGLDDVVAGGVPRGHLYLVEGTPGAGKTTLGLQFLLEGQRRGERSVYVTLSETQEEIEIVAHSHGWSLEGINVLEIVGEEGLDPSVEQSILHSSEVELGETIQRLLGQLETLQPSRLVFDSLSELRLLAQDPLRFRRQILSLKHFFARRDCTVLLLDDVAGAQGDVQIHSIAHGVVSLVQSTESFGSVRRFLKVAKLRGVKYRGGEHDMLLDTGGMQVFPRLVAAEHESTFEHGMVGTGVAELDRLLGGGVARGSNVLLVGPSGAGKTTTALSIVAAAVARGERASYYLFDESPITLLKRCDALSLPIRQFLAEGRLDLISLDPAEVSPGQFAQMVRQAVQRDGSRTVVIDSLNAYLQAMPGSRFLLLQMHELLSFLNHQGVVTLLVMGQHGIIGEIHADIDLSYLSDAILLYRFFEASGNLLKAVSVTKSRTSRHELTIREFRIGRQGVEVGPALTDFDGVLAGVPHYKGQVRLLSSGDRIVGADEA